MMTNALEKFATPSDSEILRELKVDRAASEGVFTGAAAAAAGVHSGLYAAKKLKERAEKKKSIPRKILEKIKKGPDAYGLKGIGKAVARHNAKVAGAVGLIGAGGLAGGLVAENKEKERLGIA